MKKKTLTLDELKVESFAVSMNNEQMANTKGGIYIIRGRRFDYRIRWTSLDTRTEMPESSAQSPRQ